MDGSKFRSAVEGSEATRAAMTIDRDAVGLMKHASQLSHLIEWWLQGSSASLEAIAAFQIGRRLERFRLAARLAEGRSSNQVKLTLEALRTEVMLYEVPEPLQVELNAALKESERVKASSVPPLTLVREAPAIDASPPVRAAALKPDRRRARLLWLCLALMVTVAAWWAVGRSTAASDLLHMLLRR
jgi:hypothetical protein